MSTLYNLKIDIDKSTEDRIYLSIRATNHEDQKNPKAKIFYYTVIGDIYYYLKTNKFGFGTYIIQKGKTSFIENPIFEKYSSVLEDSLKIKDYSIKLFSSYKNKNEIENLFDLEILEEYENNIDNEEEDEEEIKCAYAKIVLISKNEGVFLPLKNISEIDIYFDESYL